MERVTQNYCAECNWSISTEDHDRDELAPAAIEHSIETGHDIESDAPSPFTSTRRHPILHFRLFNYKERILQ
jgi:hypothetical protein